ncbi:MAG: IclR family transcriptional regulator [Deltaproteobacteria bacterium]|nr:IclR family transcriptional regulator [Deltaproteobacteria bacterium]
MKRTFKRVPALDKGFGILRLLAKSKTPMGISEISKRLNYNKSTVSNIAYTLCDLGILENGLDGKFWFGTELYLLGRAAGKGSELIQTVRPFLEEIQQETDLSLFLGIRSGDQAVIIDKVDSSYDLRISSEVGMRLPLLAGAGGKALLAQLTDEELDVLLSNVPLKKFTPNTRTHKSTFRAAVLKVRESGVAYDFEEYIEGIVAIAVPLKTYRQALQAAIWAIGLKRQVPEDAYGRYEQLLKEAASHISLRFSMA